MPNPAAPRHEDRDERSADRHELELKAHASIGGRAVPFRIGNISHTGFLAQSAVALSAGDSVTVELPELGPQEARVVWAGEGVAGFNFASPLSRSALSIALLRSSIAKCQDAAVPPPVPVPERLAAAMRVDGPEAREEDNCPGARLPFRKRLAILCVAAAAPWFAIGGVLLAL
jgi:hypothetical protein